MFAQTSLFCDDRVDFSCKATSWEGLLQEHLSHIPINQMTLMVSWVVYPFSLLQENRI